MDEIYTIGRELDLMAEQERTLATPRLPANLMLRWMFLTFDIVYGRARSLPKVLVLEILARYPYWAWEDGGYRLLSKLHSRTRPASLDRIKVALRHVRMGREAQDNEQWHMLLWADICRQKGIRLSWFRHFWMPRVMTFIYYCLTRLMYRFRPVSSFAMNAAFESHAEHEYMQFAWEHTEFDDEPVHSIWFDRYPRQKSLGDLIRRVALDERDHMNRSLEEISRLGGGPWRENDEIPWT